MSAPRATVLRRAEPDGPASEGVRGLRSWIGHRHAVPAVPALVTLVVSLLGISRPSFWLDEAATISMVRRSLPDLLRTVDHLDLVHALYYLLMKPWTAVFGTGEPAMRFPTALATALAAAGVAVVGRRCASPRLGVYAGIVFGCNVTITRYAQEARPFAMVIMAAVLSTYLFVRTTQTRGRRWPWLVGYAFSLILVTLVNLFGLMLALAHAATLLWLRLSGRVGRADLVGWTASAAGAGLVLAPFALKARQQSDQIFIRPATMSDKLWDFLVFLAGDEWLIPVVAVLAVLGVVARLGPDPAADRPGPTLSMLAVPWLLIPPVLLLAADAFDSIFRPRYVMFCMPALALLAAAGLVRSAGFRRPLLAAALAGLLALSLPAHLEIRRQDSRLDDLRAAADVLRAHARPGDAILFLTRASRWDAEAYDDAYAGLRDVLLKQTPAQAGNLVGTDVTKRRVIVRRLLAGDRVWLMQERSISVVRPGLVERRMRALRAAGPYVKQGEWKVTGVKLTLMVRRASGGDPSGWTGPSTPRPKGP